MEGGDGVSLGMVTHKPVPGEVTRQMANAAAQDVVRAVRALEDYDLVVGGVERHQDVVRCFIIIILRTYCY